MALNPFLHSIFILPRFMLRRGVATVLTAVLVPLAIGCEPTEDVEVEPSAARQEAEAQRERIREELASLRKERVELDETVWAQERLAQEYERPITKLWDALKDSEEPLKVLGEVSFEGLTIGPVVGERDYDHGLRVVRYGEPTDGNEEVGEGRSLDAEQWREALADLREAGWRLKMTDWHHAAFEVDPPRSTVSANLYAAHPDRERYLDIHADLRIEWAEERGDDELAVPRKVAVTGARVTEGVGEPMFTEMAELQADSPTTKYLEPILVYDLDGDGLSEIILASANRVYWNRGGGEFERDVLLEPRPWGDNAIVGAVLADFTGDGRVDLLCAASEGRRGRLLLYEGDESGRFPDPPVLLNSPEQPIRYAAAIAVGDIDGDGDLDLYVTQYKPPVRDGQMPTPYYNANDGHPSYLYRNDGEGEFTEITESAGLAEKRFRRTYSSSFVDIDDDGDLDLLVVSDFAGVDLYHNDGTGRFTDVSEQLPERHTFGMAHTFDDFNGDGLLDFYAIGMSSTTARRLERMGLGREEFPRHQEMRMKMGYGNYLYLGAEEGGFALPEWNDAIARTGWSWGTSSFDFDNDGDRDLYVANGHISGESTQDYCTTFWCHDIYTGDSEPDAVTDNLLQGSLRDLYAGEESWNGYEKNVLFMNRGGEGFLNVAYPMGVAFEFDARSVVTDDLDGDGRVDLLVLEQTRENQVLRVLRNEVEGSGNWIGVRLREHGDGYSPVGAKIILHTPGGSQTHRFVTGDSFSAQHANTAHFGLGGRKAVDSIEIRWPNGRTTRIDSPAVNQYHEAEPDREAVQTVEVRTLQ